MWINLKWLKSKLKTINPRPFKDTLCSKLYSNFFYMIFFNTIISILVALYFVTNICVYLHVGSSDCCAWLRGRFQGNGWVFRCNEGFIWVWSSGLRHIYCWPIWIHLVWGHLTKLFLSLRIRLFTSYSNKCSFTVVSLTGTCPLCTPIQSSPLRVQSRSTRSWWIVWAVILSDYSFPNTSLTMYMPCGARRPQRSLLPLQISSGCW